MGGLFESKITEERRPVVLLFGKNPLLVPLIQDFLGKFSVMYIGEDAGIISKFAKEDAFYALSSKNYNLAQFLEEKIDYGVAFLSGRQEKRIFEDIAQRFEKDNTRLVIVIPIRIVQEFQDDILVFRKNKNFSFLLLGDLFGRHIPQDLSPVSALLDAVCKRHIIAIQGNELNKVLPISENDAIFAIKRMLFGFEKKKNIFYLFYPVPQTFISCIHLLKREEPDLVVQHYEGVQQEEDIELSEIEKRFGEKPEYLALPGNFEQEAARVIEGNSKEESEEENFDFEEYKPRAKSNKKTEERMNKKNGFFFFVFLEIIIIFLLNLFLFFGFLFFAKKAVDSFFAGNLEKSAFYKGLAENIAPFLTPLTTNLSRDNFLLANSALSGINLAQDIYQETGKLGGQTANINRLTADITSLAFLVLENEKNLPSNPIIKKTAGLAGLANLLPSILGFDREKSYLVLFQNNGEIRPTGGFIGSLAQITIKNGKVEKIEIRDAYEVDGQLKAHIEPPFVVRRYLQPHLYLRDSNFGLEFQEAASRSALLYNLETGRRVDGVIGIDYFVLKKILEELGPLYLSSYKKELNADNAFDFIENTIEKGSFPGSLEKKTILENIFAGISEKIGDPKNEIKVAKLIPSLLIEKHILFGFPDPSLQDGFVGYGLAGSYKDLRQKDKNTVYDTLFVNEANIGVNKANIGVERSLDYNVEIDSQQISSSIVLRLTNNSKDDYKVYLRFGTNTGSSLGTIKINGQEQKITPFITDYRIYEAKNFKPPKELEVYQGVEEGYTVFGFITTVQAKSTQIIEVSYKNAAIPPKSTLFSYSLLHFKQPGVDKYNLNLSIKPPAGFSPVVKGNFENEKLLFSSQINSDEEFRFEFRK